MTIKPPYVPSIESYERFNFLSLRVNLPEWGDFFLSDDYEMACWRYTFFSVASARFSISRIDKNEGLRQTPVITIIIQNSTDSVKLPNSAKLSGNDDMAC